MKTFLGPLKKYATFSGRASRKEFWGFFGWSLLITVVIGITEGFVYATSLTEYPGMSIGMGIFFLATLIPYWAVAVRRLHDTGRSGWWFLIVIIPLINIVFIVFMCLKSKDDDNPYGPPGDL